MPEVILTTACIVCSLPPPQHNVCFYRNHFPHWARQHSLKHFYKSDSWEQCCLIKTFITFLICNRMMYIHFNCFYFGSTAARVNQSNCMDTSLQMFKILPEYSRVTFLIIWMILWGFFLYPGHTDTVQFRIKSEHMIRSSFSCQILKGEYEIKSLILISLPCPAATAYSHPQLCWPVL